MILSRGSGAFHFDHFQMLPTFIHYAKDLPIIDYHCHLPPAEIANNRQFENLTQIWLAGDHYKWRAMRTLGIDERFITGHAPDREKFEKWAYAVPYTMRNPLYHWTHLELLRYFDLPVLLNPDSASHVYDACHEKLGSAEFSTRSLLKKMNVVMVGTTDDPADSLDHHHQLKHENFDVRILPSFRPDKAYAVENITTYLSYLETLASASGVVIASYADLLYALEKRIDFFHNAGCRIADHGLEQLYFFTAGQFDIERLFQKIRNHQSLMPDEAHYFKFHTMLHLCRQYHQRGWVQQFHLGAMRNTNTRMMQALGPDTGFDSIGDFSQAVALSRFLNQLDQSNQLAKTILYNLNPADNEVIATMTGNFNDGSVKGKIQFGSAWWFLDQKDGMENQLNTLSNLGLLSCFIGMLTDSRSFLSYPRHEYFRRILCNLIGRDVQNGELPNDEKWLGKLVADVCYYNAKAYFSF
jgi:glucuronate isomerase